MQIAAFYGTRLNVKFSNLKPEALDVLAQTYPSHSFVIDVEEANGILNRVRAASEVEKKLVQAIGRKARFPTRDLAIECLTDNYAQLLNEGSDEDENQTQNEAGGNPVQGATDINGGNPEAAGEGGVSQSDEAEAALGDTH